MDELLIEAKLENMERVQTFIAERLEDCHPKVRNHIGIAVDEIFSNIAGYAYYPLAGIAFVRIAVGSDIVIEFEDNGVAYDPFSQNAPDVSLPIEERETGGLGLFMVKKIMDSVEYQRKGNKNILTIRKNLQVED